MDPLLTALGRGPDCLRGLPFGRQWSEDQVDLAMTWIVEPTGIPAVIGGIATSQFGLHKTALVYSVSVAVLAAAAVGLLIRQMASGRARGVTHHPNVPPGPGTVPPCPPTSPRLGEATA